MFLTDDTIRKNIAFGIKDEFIDDGMINKAIKMAQLEDFINLSTSLILDGIRCLI